MQVVGPKENPLGFNAKPSGSVSAAYTGFSYRIAGGTPPYTFSESPYSPLPPGMTLSASGMVSGTPTQVGNFTIAPIVMDSAGNTFNISGTAWIITPSGKAPPLVATTGASFDTPSAGVPMAGYEYELSQFVQTGTPPYNWTVASGSSLPPGMVLLPGSNGVSTYLGGIPSSAGNFNFSLVVTDATAQSVTVPCSIAVSPLSLTPGYLPNGMVGTTYPTTTLVPSGGTAPYTFSVYGTDGMPPGMTLTAAGVLSGTPVYPGFFQIGVIVTDANNLTVDKLYDVTIDNAAGQSPAISLGGVPIQLFAGLGATTNLFGSVIPTSTTGSLTYNMSLSGLPGESFPAGGTTGPTQTFFVTVPATTPAGVYAGILAVDSALATNRVDSIPVVLTVAPAPACSYILTPNSNTIMAAGGGGTFSVQTSPACNWSATVSDPTWLSFSSASSGTGTGSISYTALANTGSDRMGIITVSGQEYIINQFGPSICSFSLNPSSLTVGSAGGQATINVISSCASTNPSSAWTATGLSASPASGQGSAPVTVTIPANTTFSPVVLNATIASQTLTVNQSAANCNATLNSPAYRTALAAAADCLRSLFRVDAVTTRFWVLAGLR